MKTRAELLAFSMVRCRDCCGDGVVDDYDGPMTCDRCFGSGLDKRALYDRVNSKPQRSATRKRLRKWSERSAAVEMAAKEST
jgi:hypothetical protein